MSKKLPDERTLEKMTSDFVGAFESGQYKNGLDLAQGIINNAWETDDVRKRVDLAYKALSLSPDCADAYILLAEESTGTPEEAVILYRKALKAARSTLPALESPKAQRLVPGMHPYVRAAVGLANSLLKMKKLEEAIAAYRDILDLNPEDIHGVRFVLVSCYIEMGFYNDLETLLNSRFFEKDTTADWLYTRALLSFIKHRGSYKSAEILLKALESNSFVPSYLSGLGAVPPELPHIVSAGSEEEAMCYASDFKEVWHHVPHALQWLQKCALEYEEQLANTTSEERQKVPTY